MQYSNYKEEYLEKQVDLVKTVTKGWGFGYPNKKQLKELYSRENFTADTRHYYFDGDDLVGFVSSAVENQEGEIQYGSIQLPFVNLSDQDKKMDLENKLIDKAKIKLMEKGVNVIRSNFDERWPIDNIRSLYEEKEPIQRSAEIMNYKNIELGPSSGKIVEMDMESTYHIDAFHKGILSQFPEMTREEMVNILKQAQEGEGFVKRYLAIENDMVVAQGRVGIYENEAVVLIFAYHLDGVKYKPEIIKMLINEIKDDDSVKTVRLTHTYSDAAPEEGFDEFNFEFSALRRYEMKLN